jgi:hypothetical protein
MKRNVAANGGRLFPTAILSSKSSKSVAAKPRPDLRHKTEGLCHIIALN